ncbi:VOC family protein [Pararhizobium sp.]|uniref:VOC family protein n=1 Tax=Pararhizobium sp. TaxID=1977563 RepID=UPI002727617D|nr:VOC family protein [Pararhizobium sp.]MDO9416936.1 VOC family protein [Pararhizobium sp.]
MRHSYSLDHIALLVRDLARSTAFYRDIMGFEPIERSGGINVGWLTIGGIDTIHLIEADFGKTHLTKDTHFALRIADLDAFVADITEKGVSFCDWQGNEGKIGLHRKGFRQVYVQDPDGYWVEVNDHGMA